MFLFTYSERCWCCWLSLLLFCFCLLLFLYLILFVLYNNTHVFIFQIINNIVEYIGQLRLYGYWIQLYTTTAWLSFVNLFYLYVELFKTMYIGFIYFGLSVSQFSSGYRDWSFMNACLLFIIIKVTFLCQRIIRVAYWWW